MSDMNSYPETPQQPATQPTYMPPTQKRNPTMYLYAGAFCAFVSLFIVPEIFGGAAIILGAYCWRLDCGENRNRGVWLIVFALIAMFIGLYYTSFFAVYDILP